MRFNKPPLSIDKQIELLETRGIIFGDRLSARTHLAHISYYRLTAYWLNFEADHATHTFKRGTWFESILNLYVFDRELRLLVLDAIERVEVSLRSQWAYHLSHNHGSHAYLDSTVAQDYNKWERDLERLKEEIRRSDEIFITNYSVKYKDPQLPPAYSVCEVMSLGSLSHWFSNLKPMKTRRGISHSYGLDEGVLQAFMHHLTYVRNLCAHHSRLWNRQLTFTMQLPRTKPANLAGSFNAADKRKIYNTLVMLAWMLDQISPGHTWKKRLLDLIRQHNINPTDMGFPADYNNRDIWENLHK